MSPTLLLSAALVAPGAPVPADADAAPGPAPRVFALKADAAGAVRFYGTVPTKVTVTNTYFVIENVVVNGVAQQQQVQKQVEQDVVTSQYVNKTLAEFGGTFATAAGAPLSVEEAAARLKGGAPLLASADGKPVSKLWLRAAHPDTVVMVAEGLAHVQPQHGGGGILPLTPAPRLVRLGTDDGGRVIAACTDSPNVATLGYSYYGEDLVFEGRGKRLGGYYAGTQQQYEGKVVNRPLAEVPFDAYDRTGKLVPRSVALKRLAAGGTVLVAGGTTLPDENYLKALRDDVLVLVGADLVLPVVPVDQTKKRDPNAKDEKAAPALPPVQLRALPVIAPAVLKRPAAGIIQVAPAAVKPVPVEEKKEEKKAEKNEKK